MKTDTCTCTCPHTKKSVEKCDKPHAKIKLLTTHFYYLIAVLDQDMCLYWCYY